MATKICSKKRFLEMLEKQLNDTDIILLSGDMVGSISVSKKQNMKKVTFGFAANAFKRDNDIGGIAFGETPALSFCICKKKDISDSAYEALLKEK